MGCGRCDSCGRRADGLAPGLRQVVDYWTLSPSQSGDWSNAANWSIGVPTSSLQPVIENGGTATITTPGDVCQRLYLGVTAGSGNAQMTNGSLTASQFEFVGYAGTGTFVQTGGTNNVIDSGYLMLGYTSGYSGTYSLSSSGLLSINGLFEAGYYGMGSFLQSGGTVSVANGTSYLAFYQGSGGTYGLSGSGLLSAASQYVGYGGTGIFTQSGGTNVVQSGLDDGLTLGFSAGASGGYILSGNGLLSVGGLTVGYSGAGTFTQSSGTNDIPAGPYNGLLLGKGWVAAAPTTLTAGYSRSRL